jgi:hypothetical protein
MKRFGLLMSTLLCLSMVAPDARAATVVRGRVDFALAGGMVPMNGATVALCVVGGGCLSYRTGPDGMYYFSTPPGSYVLQVNALAPVPLSVPNQDYVDVPPLRGN